MKSFLQAAAAAKENEDDDLSFTQPQAKMVAYESSSGGIVSAIEDMQGKAEDTLSDLRKKEMQAAHSYDLVKGALEGEIKNSEDKLSTAKSSNAAATEAEGAANGELVATTKAKAADEAYAATLKTDVQDYNGDTALHDAARFGHAKVCEHLLKAGASTTIKNKLGQTPYDTAVAYGYPKLLKSAL